MFDTPEGNIDSPNWGWAKIGYKIERSGKTRRCRTIKDSEGSTVLHAAGHEAECEWLRSRGVIETKGETK